MFWAVFGVCFLADASEVNTDKDNLALKGYDPVSYYKKSGPRRGLETLVAESDGTIYRFATEENRKAFLESPASFEPQFGGWCAWAMLDGEKVEVDPLAYRIFDEKLLVFYDGFWGDTKKKWIEKSEKETESRLYEKATEMWNRVKAKN